MTIMPLLKLFLVTLLSAITLSAHGGGGALIFDSLPGDTSVQSYSLQVFREGLLFASLPVPSGTGLQIDAKSMTVNDSKTVSIFRGNATARVKLADEVVYVVSAEELRVVLQK